MVLVGPAHRVSFRGLATVTHQAWATPLGEVEVDREAVDTLLPQPGVAEFDPAHAQEHGLEVHLPFLQYVLRSRFSIVPLLFSDATRAVMVDAIDTVWGGSETLIVISSDLSHFLSYQAARREDAATADAIVRCDPDAIRPDAACGHLAVQAALELGRDRGLSTVQLDLRSSGDTAGPRDRVVGYGAWAMS